MTLCTLLNSEKYTCDALQAFGIVSVSDRAATEMYMVAVSLGPENLGKQRCLRKRQMQPYVLKLAFDLDGCIQPACM